MDSNTDPPPSLRSVREAAERLLAKCEQQSGSTDLTALHEVRTELQDLVAEVRQLQLKAEDRRFFKKVIRTGAIHLAVEFVKVVVTTQFYIQSLSSGRIRIDRWRRTASVLAMRCGYCEPVAGCLRPA
jgi:aspartate/tyrosine/aromatic aminotransferase